LKAIILAVEGLGMASKILCTQTDVGADVRKASRQGAKETELIK